MLEEHPSMPVFKTWCISRLPIDLLCLFFIEVKKDRDISRSLSHHQVNCTGSAGGHILTLEHGLSIEKIDQKIEELKKASLHVCETFHTN